MFVSSFGENCNKKFWKSNFLQIFNSHEKYISSYRQIISIPFSGSFQLSPLAPHPSYPHANSRRQILKIRPPPCYFEAHDVSDGRYSSYIVPFQYQKTVCMTLFTNNCSLNFWAPIHHSASTLYLVFCWWCVVMNPSFITCYNALNKCSTLIAAGIC